MIILRHTQPLVFGSDLEISGAYGGAAPVLPCYYLTFDGANDYISLAGITIAPPFTIVAWTKRTAAWNWDVVIGKNGAAGPILAMSAGNLIYNAFGGAAQSNASAALTWTHLAAVCPVGPATMTVFRNGVDVTAAPLGVAVGNLVYNQIGRGNSDAYCWNGQLAAIGIAPGIINVAALYAAGTFHKPLSAATWTVACWNGRTEGGAGVALDDESAGGNDGTFKGAGEPTWGGQMIVGGPAGWSDV
ncbi:MAG: LamG-like jellyroll fold domain-containing protein [Planctomycetaceae bacterium]